MTFVKPKKDVYQNICGKGRVNISQVRKGDITAEDVARALSRIPRYCGHTKEPYYVAQHCVLMALYARDIYGDKTLALHCLLHEVGEAFAVGDIHGTFKRNLGAEATAYINAHEERLLKCFGINELLPLVHDIDSRILLTELDQLFHDDLANVDFKSAAYRESVPLDIEIKPWTSEHAYLSFINLYNLLTTESEIRASWDDTQ